MAIGGRNSVGGDLDPRSGDDWFTENARDWISDDKPSDKLNHIAKIGQHFGYPYCHEGTMLDPKYGKGRSCSEFTPPALNLGAPVAPLGMKFYTGSHFPAAYPHNILTPEPGSRHPTTSQAPRHRRALPSPTRRHASRSGQRLPPPAGGSSLRPLSASPRALDFGGSSLLCYARSFGPPPWFAAGLHQQLPSEEPG